MTNEEIAQQQQLGQLASLLNTLSETNLSHAQTLSEMQHQIQGFTAAFQVFAEFVMAASPEVKSFIGTTTTQMLARPESMSNETLVELIQALQAAATSKSRTTPEGRRAGFQVIPGGESEDEA